ncbi:Crp/Fnr family transcriptional regulator [Kineobactrum sediminis]|uniref:Crp/Fnr family transcriptional regulator n=1 Tax=Kineobactrum sediminis TaxID=1905677 RepID=UPI00138FC971|nr:Crp/Fnr family transcriptional regulator [Kineobactrum sediminis]
MLKPITGTGQDRSIAPYHFARAALKERTEEVSEVDELFRTSKVKHFPSKEVIYCENDCGNGVYLIHSGMVKLVSYLSNGRARIVRLHSDTHWFGLEGLVDQAYEHTAIAVGSTSVVFVPMSSIHLLEREHPQRYCRLLKQGYRQLAQADKWIADFSTGRIQSRVARLISFLSELEYGDASDKVDLLTVHEMADMLGATPESVSRVLASFKRNDILYTQGGAVRESYGIDAQRLHFFAQQ